MLAKMKGLFSRVRVFWGIVAVFALLPAAGGSIVWDAPKPITSLEDVSTNGAMVYAHFCYFSYWTSLYPRGQRFLPWHKNTHAGIVKFAEDAELRPGQYGRNTVSTNLIDLLTGTDQERDQYRRLLYCSVESARSKKGEPLTLRLKQLQPGMRYEVQLWSNANTDTNWCDQPMLV